MSRSERAARWWLPLLLGVSVATWTGAANADEQDQAAARVLFDEGRKLVDSGNFAAACPKFEESLKLAPGVGTSFNLADCEERIGQTASAWARFLEVAAATKADGQQEKERVARARAAALEPKLTRLLIDVPSPVAGLEVTRDGLRVGGASWGVAVPVDPGTHVVEAKAPGRQAWSASSTLPSGPATVTVSVPELEPAPEMAPAMAETTPSAATEPARSPTATKADAAAPSRWSWPVIGLGVVGVAGLATGGVFALKTRSENTEAKSLCPESSCGSDGEKQRHDELVADAHRDQSIALVSTGVGAVALASAIYLWWRAKPSTTAKGSATATRLDVRPVPTLDGAAMAITW